ncbi:MAG: NAD-dependent succinate-semialdehyde dehydrogenase [Methanobacteriota archaeon]
MVLVSINPATEEILKKFTEWDTKKINTQLINSQHAFNDWKKVDYSERSKLLKNIAQILRKNKQKYAHLMTLEMGKPITQSEAEVEKCVWVCEYYAEHGKQFLKNEYIDTGVNTSYVRFSPLGIILAVMPWNFPFWQVLRCAAPALMAGNVVLLKHSSNVPQCALTLEGIVSDAGFPHDVFKSLLVGSQAVENIIKDRRIAAVSLTGSGSAGRNVATVAGSCPKKVVLELGGSDPFIVLSDAEIDHVVEQAVTARMINNGQSCIAAKRFIIDQRVFGRFSEGFSQKVQELIVGDPLERTTDIGPLARKDILEQLDDQVKQSILKGARVLTGGKKVHSGPGYYYLPTVLSNIKKGMPVYEEEVFGPVASLIKVKDSEEAVKVANDTSYGLGASIWTTNIKSGETLTKDIEAGAVFVNEIVKSDPRLPFGGIKNSGYGRELSHYSMKEFVNIQTVYIKK